MQVDFKIRRHNFKTKPEKKINNNTKISKLGEKFTENPFLCSRHRVALRRLPLSRLAGERACA
jgi:hypothetical protein